MNRRSLTRKPGKRRYKNMYVIAAEGSTTEPFYFAMFNDENNTIHIKFLPGKSKSAPEQVLSRMKEFLRRERLQKDDEAWLVVDKDQWEDDDLQKLYEWSRSKDNYGLAVSNPKFEFWLLLHFEDGKSVSTATQCDRKLKRYIPNYSKNCVVKKHLFPLVPDACERAKQKDSPPCSDWPRSKGSTVYRLVEKLI